MITEGNSDTFQNTEIKFKTIKDLSCKSKKRNLHNRM